MVTALVGFPQKKSLRQGLKCKKHKEEMISGNTGKVEEEWNREEKEADRECNAKPKATVVNLSLIPL